MSNLKFAGTHNLVAFLKKPEESDGFEEIIDFLNASYVEYALTVNPTIYTTCVEQFWASAKAKIVNGERKIQALIDKKKVIITETSIRSNLKLDVAEGIDCLPTATTFTELERIGRKQRKDSAPTEPVTDAAHVSTPSYDPPKSGKDSLQLLELMNLCTSLHEKVLDLEKAKTSQAKEIAILKKRVKQLEKRRKSRNLGLRRLRKGRKIKDLDADAKVTLVNETQEMNDNNLMFDTGVLEEKEIEFEKVVEEPVVSVATTRKSILVSTAEVVTTASASVEISVTSVRPRAKGIIFQDQEEQVPAYTKTFSSSQSQLLQVKYKGKGKMVEHEVPLKKKDQVALDEEMARNLEAQLQAELIEEERLAKQKEEEANIALIES
ncbi:hypothetical protein Tco_0451974 [Tanacetum coccineum]